MADDDETGAGGGTTARTGGSELSGLSGLPGASGVSGHWKPLGAGREAPAGERSSNAPVEGAPVTPAAPKDGTPPAAGARGRQDPPESDGAAASAITPDLAAPDGGSAAPIVEEAAEAPEVAGAPEAAEVAGAPEAPDDDSDIVRAVVAKQRARVRRRRRRGRVIVVVVLLVLVLAAGGVGVCAEFYVRSQITSAVRSAMPGLSSDAEVTTKGLVLPQVLNGELDSLEVTAAELDLPSAGGADGQDSADGDDDAEQGGLELLGVDVALTAIGLSDPFPAGSMDATASVGWDQLTTMVEAAKPSAPALSVQAGDLGTADDPGTMIASTKVFGIDASMTIAPAVADDGGLLLTVTSVTIRGTELDVNSTFYGRPVLSYLGLETPEISIGADKLPQGLSLDRVSVTDTGLSLTLSGSDVELANL